NYTPEQAHHLLNSSFAQFLADRGVVALERARTRDREALDGYRKNMVCDLGDFDEYWGLLEAARRLRDEERRGREQARGDAVREAVAGLRPGAATAGRAQKPPGPAVGDTCPYRR